MAKAGICVMCGLPGAGKTTMCNYLKNSEGFSFIHVCYDKLLPWIDFSKADVFTTWKAYRNEVLNLVETQVKAVLEEKQDANLIKDFHLLLEKEKEQVVASVNELMAKKNCPPVIFLIDDNMSYRRMRHEYYQLARKFSISFCIAMVDCPLSECQARNQTRMIEEVVKQRSLMRINAQMEKPDQAKAKWEEYNCVINTLESDMEDAASKITSLLSIAIVNPVPILQAEDTALIEETRRVNLLNFKHQVDICLRKLTKEILAQETNKKVFAEKLNIAKKYIFNEVKYGQIDETEYIDESGKINHYMLKCKLEAFINAYTLSAI